MTDVPVGTLVKITIDLPGVPARLIGKVARTVSAEETGFGVYVVHQAPAVGVVDSGLKGASSKSEHHATDIRDERLKRLQGENERLTTETEQILQQVRDLEEENLDFANQIVRTEEINNNLTNLYIASSRLHSVLDREQVAEIIKEITINFVGAEKFALLLYNKGSDTLDFMMGEGFAPDEFPPSIMIGQNEIFKQTAQELESFFVEDSVVQGPTIRISL